MGCECVSLHSRGVWKIELPHWHSAPRDLWKNILFLLMETPPWVWVLGGLKMWGKWARDTSRCYTRFSLKLLRFRCLFMRREAPGYSCSNQQVVSTSALKELMGSHRMPQRGLLAHFWGHNNALWKVLHVNFFGDNSFKDYIKIWQRRIQIRMFTMFQDARFSCYYCQYSQTSLQLCWYCPHPDCFEIKYQKIKCQNLHHSRSFIVLHYYILQLPNICHLSKTV